MSIPRTKTERNERIAKLAADERITLAAIGERFGLTKQRVEQIARQAGLPPRVRIKLRLGGVCAQGHPLDPWNVREFKGRQGVRVVCLECGAINTAKVLGQRTITRATNFEVKQLASGLGFGIPSFAQNSIEIQRPGLRLFLSCGRASPWVVKQKDGTVLGRANGTKQLAKIIARAA